MANPAAAYILGYSEDELVGQAIEVLVPDNVRQAHPTHRDAYFASPQNRPMGFGRDLRARRKDGTEFPAEISLSSVSTARGPLAVAFLTDISKRKADEDAIRRQREDLRNLSGQLMSAQDDERRRIARDLHDDLSQKLAYLAIDLGRIGMKPEATLLVDDLRPLQTRATEASNTVRHISHQLHPSVLDDGLSTRWYVLTFGTDSSLTTGPGWDNVTGLGTPNGATFVGNFVSATAPVKK
jgi:PAS domain S-box-containing protein